MPGRSEGLILGIDPGLAGTGFALLAEPNVVLACSTVVTIPGRDGARLLTITNHLRSLLAEHPPAEASIEELFMGRNATSAVGVAQARGAILAVLEECAVPVFEYKPSQVKVILTGYGNADKAQIARMLSAQVKVPEGRLDDHARDAIAIALCHARSRRFSRAATARPDPGARLQ
ncbi:MAG TPA: crossover junction endodeoxyribonuclease RuvC [Candidatus Sulfotelmatobacter sp.]|nr:crossover junction endodeoxyribonuclease RuvC [Candidatus Sulfotelmatobacter sp.]